MTEYVCRYRKYYGADSWDYIWSELPMQEGYAYIAGAMSMDGWLQFSGVGIADGGFIRGEVDRIMKENK